jgi:hypothetical protein
MIDISGNDDDIRVIAPVIDSAISDGSDFPQRMPTKKKIPCRDRA